jgi:6-phosphogluconolactonase
MKTKRLAVSGLALASLVLLLSSCPNPIGSSNSRGGSLSIQLTNNINARTLLPPIDMNAASFTVSGTGPGGASFSQTTSGGLVTVSGLAFGSWSVMVNALNAGGTLIGSGQSTVTVHTGQTSTVDISVVPLGGSGTLTLTVTWTASQVETPSIHATLTPASGPATPLSFSVSGNQATYSSTTIPAGYQTLTLQLLDNNIPVMGAVDVARIVAGQMTTGSYAFTNVNQPGGSVMVNITPAMADPIPVSISGVGSTITAGTSITATASVSDGTANVVYVWYLNGVSQATGSSDTFGSALSAGYYRLDVTAYTADGTRAGSGTASFQVMGANGSAGRYVYVSNYGSNTVSAYAIGSGGLLTPLSTPTFAGGSAPYGIAMSPNGSFLYVTNYGPSTVSGYVIGSGGLLTPLSTPTFTTGSGPRSDPYGIAVTPSGSFLYVANSNDNTVSAFAIGSSGLLTPLSTPTFATGTGPMEIAVTPNGSFLYVTNFNSNTVSAFAISSNGLLTPLSTPAFAAGSAPYGIAVTPNGSLLYVTNNYNSTVSAYTIGSGGLLAPLNTPTFATGAFPMAVSVTPNGSFLYVTNSGGNTVSAYAIGSSGLLTPLSPPTFTAGTQPFGVAVSPNGSFLYVTNGASATVSAYAIGSGGLLTPLSTPTFATGSAPIRIVVVP